MPAQLTQSDSAADIRRAERRRRGRLYGPPPPLRETTRLDGRILWHIGDWGRASEHIGNRWETLAPELLRETLAAGQTLFTLADEPALMAEVLATGLPHADALLLELRALAKREWHSVPHLALEPLDFKWSLETASRGQVSAETCARLLEAASPRLTAALEAARHRVGLASGVPPQPADGRFIAPRHPANRRALRHDPTLPCVLLPVAAQVFFSVLPGWPAARALARMEEIDADTLQDLQLAERYYRLGAGVRGALARAETPLFEDALLPVDGERWIDTWHTRHPSGSINRLLIDLEEAQSRRRKSEERLAALPRGAYSFGTFRADITRWDAQRLVDARGGAGRMYGTLVAAVLDRAREVGRELVTGGLSETEALDRLAEERPRWATEARTEFMALLRAPSAQEAATSSSSSSVRQ